MSVGAEREMTLKEWVERLPKNHTARKEYDAKVKFHRLMKRLILFGVIYQVLTLISVIIYIYLTGWHP